MKRLYILCIFVVLMILDIMPVNSREIIAYYPSWRWKLREKRVIPQFLPYDKISIINYAFFIPLENGEITGMDPEADAVLLEGKTDNSTEKYRKENSIIHLAHQHNVRVMVSIGGWEDSGLFPEIAADKKKRSRFAESCIDQIKKYGFDGIDIDWEYPGYEPHNGSPRDRENFNLLLQAIRDNLNILQKQTGKQYLLTAALPANPDHVAKIDIETIFRILDYLNVMTYDFHGPWDPITNHNTPLYPPAEGDSVLCMDVALRLYRDRYKVPSNKINLGIAFYGRAYQGCSQLFSAHKGEEQKMFGGQGGSDYVQIVKYNNLFTRHWDDQAEVPYLTSDSLNIFISYDDPESISLKSEYIVKNNAGGVIIWQIMGDFFEDDSTPLLDQINQVFHNTE